MLSSTLGKYLLPVIWILIAGLCTPALVRAEGDVVTIRLEGLSGQQKENVESAIELPAGIIRDGIIQGRWLKRFVEKIPERVAVALQPFGYYNSRSSARVVQMASGRYEIRVEVDPGPETRIRTLDLQLTGDGKDNRAIRRKLKDFPLKVGDVLDHQDYEKGKLALRVEADDEGYIDADFETHRIKVFPEEDAADVELVLETGPLYYFGDVTFVEESERFDEFFLKRFLGFREGDIFSHKKLHTTRLNLYAANRFQEVLLIPHQEQAEDEVIPVEIKLTTAKMQRLRPGIGYGTDLGARVLLSYQHMDIHEGGHSLQTDINLAQKQQYAEANYFIPRQKTSNDNLILTLGFLKEDLNVYDTKKSYGEIERAYGLGLGKTGSIALGYLRENYEIGTDKGLARLTMPALRYHQRSYDDPVNPKRGYQFRLELRGAYDDFLSDITLAQVIAAGSFMYPFHKRFTLHTRAEWATTLKDDEFAKIPPTLRFFAGGDKSVRGYGYKSQGPRDENGDVIGGDSLIVGSIECEYSLSDKWGVAAFYDMGSAYNEAFDDVEFIEGIGVGFRRYTPIGPIKVDFAHRLTGNHTFRIHLSVGFDI